MHLSLSRFLSLSLTHTHITHTHTHEYLVPHIPLALPPPHAAAIIESKSLAQASVSYMSMSTHSLETALAVWVAKNAAKHAREDKVTSSYHLEAPYMLHTSATLMPPAASTRSAPSSYVALCIHALP